jgi:hypothetical protein
MPAVVDRVQGELQPDRHAMPAWRLMFVSRTVSTPFPLHQPSRDQSSKVAIADATLPPSVSYNFDWIEPPAHGVTHSLRTTASPSALQGSKAVRRGLRWWFNKRHAREKPGII